MDRFKNILTSLALLCAGGVILSAQGGYGVSATVNDQYGPVVGATVVELGTQNGTTTGIDGEFTLKVVAPESMVEVSCIGYAPQTFKASQMPATITLKEDSEFIDEVVVIGYGTVKKVGIEFS